MSAVVNDDNFKINEILGLKKDCAGPFRRLFNDWELNLVQDFFATLHKVRINVNEGDKIAWKLSICVKFTTKSLYSILSCGQRCFFPSIRNMVIPPGVAFLDGKQNGGEFYIWIVFEREESHNQADVTFMNMRRKW